MTSLSQLALLPGGRLQGRCLALSAAVDKYKPVTRRVAARSVVNFGAKIAITVKKRTGQILIDLQRNLEENGAKANIALGRTFDTF